MSEIEDAPPYKSWSLPIQVMTTGPLPAPSKCKSGRFNSWGQSSTHQTNLRTVTVIVFGVVSSEVYIMPPHIFESAWKSTPMCTWMCWRVRWSPGAIRWPVADPGCSKGLGAGPQVQRDPGLTSEGVLQLCTLLSLPPPPPTWTRWTTSFGHTSRTSPTWPPTIPKPAWSPPSVEYSPSSRRRLWKRHAPSSGSVSRRSLKLNGATLNWYQLNYIIKIRELIFSRKVFKIMQ